MRISVRKLYGRIALVVLIGTLLSVSIIVAAEDENFGYSSRWDTTQNHPPETEIIVARWTYATDGSKGGFGWAHNYPSSDRNLNQFIAEATGIDIDRMSYRIQRLGDDDVFDYPFAYVSEPGEMDLTAKEVKNFREYINRGGFVLMDDFDGSRQWNNVRENVRRAFPDREWIALDIEHNVFHAHFSLDDLHAMDYYVQGGYTTYYAQYDELGNAVIIAGHNNDLANFWDWFDEPGTPIGPATDAFRLGVNYMVYSLTH